MQPVMLVGIVASFLGALWAKYEHDNPNYWAVWGIPQTAAHVIKIATLLLFPGGYLLVLFAPGSGWLFNIAMLLLTHFVVVHFLAGSLYGLVGGLRDRKRTQEMIDAAARDARDSSRREPPPPDARR